VAEYLLDSNVLILHLREDPEVVALLTRWAIQHDLYISVLTRTEILAGMRPQEEGLTMRLLNSLTNLTVDRFIADRAGRLIYDYARRGFQVSFPDALIAATALERDLTLVTTNAQPFPMLERRVRALFPSQG
jgi:predicted nucleic acid-binding protein